MKRSGVSVMNVLVAMIIGGLLLGGCAPAATPTAVPATPTPMPPTPTPMAPTPTAMPPGPTGTVTIGIAGDIDTWDPQVSRGYIAVTTAYQNLFDMLVLTDLTGTVVPQLAESWEMISPTVWEFKLKPGVKFHNGELCNAEAVCFTLKRKLETGKPRHGTVEKMGEGECEVIDDFTVRIHTLTPNPAFLQDIQTIFLLPPKYFEEVGDSGFAKHPVGTGPYKFVEWLKDDHFTLEAFEDYFDGTPKVKTLIWRVLPEDVTRLAALRTGEIDIGCQLPVEAIEEIEGEPNLYLSKVPMNQVVYLQLFAESPKCRGPECEAISDKRVRQAMAYAINLEEISEYIYKGYTKPPASVVSSITFGFDPDLKPYPYDPDKAKALLAEAGYPDGFSIQFDWTPFGIMKKKELVEAVAAYWAEVGIVAELNEQDQGTHVEQKLNWTIGPVFNWHFRGWDAGYILYNQVRKDGAWFFYTGWHQEVDDLIYAQHDEMDPEKREVLLQELLRTMYEDMPWIPLIETTSIFGLNERIGGWEPQPEADMKMHKVFIKP